MYQHARFIAVSAVAVALACARPAVSPGVATTGAISGSPAASPDVGSRSFALTRSYVLRLPPPVDPAACTVHCAEGCTAATDNSPGPRLKGPQCMKSCIAACNCRSGCKSPNFCVGATCHRPFVGPVITTLSAADGSIIEVRRDQGSVTLSGHGTNGTVHSLRIASAFLTNGKKVEPLSKLVLHENGQPLLSIAVHTTSNHHMYVEAISSTKSKSYDVLPIPSSLKALALATDFQVEFDQLSYFQPAFDRLSTAIGNYYSRLGIDLGKIETPQDLDEILSRFANAGFWAAFGNEMADAAKQVGGLPGPWGRVMAGAFWFLAAGCALVSDQLIQDAFKKDEYSPPSPTADPPPFIFICNEDGSQCTVYPCEGDECTAQNDTDSDPCADGAFCNGDIGGDPWAGDDDGTAPSEGGGPTCSDEVAIAIKVKGPASLSPLDICEEFRKSRAVCTSQCINKSCGAPDGCGRTCFGKCPSARICATGDDARHACRPPIHVPGPSRGSGTHGRSPQ